MGRHTSNQRESDMISVRNALDRFEKTGWINGFSNGATQSGAVFFDIRDKKDRGYRFDMDEVHAFIYGLSAAETALASMQAKHDS